MYIYFTPCPSLFPARCLFSSFPSIRSRRREDFGFVYHLFLVIISRPVSCLHLLCPYSVDSDAGMCKKYDGVVWRQSAAVCTPQISRRCKGLGH